MSGATCRLDHLVVAARDLEQGVDWAESELGVTPAPGGRHALMGTHNRLIALDGAEAYLEIIAIDPKAPRPGRARWFGLDTQADSLRDTPRLVHWVARSEALDAHRDALVALGHDPGPAVAAQRDTPTGTLRWRITVRDDGRVQCGGALPTLIEWQGESHPGRTLPPSGVTLDALMLRGLDARAAAVLRPHPVDLQPMPGPAVQARLCTPRGTVTLDSP